MIYCLLGIVVGFGIFTLGYVAGYKAITGVFTVEEVRELIDEVTKLKGVKK